jgi:hypothetical protein
MEKVGSLEQGEQRKGDRRNPAGDGAFKGPDRRKGERRSGSATAGERQGQRDR